MKVLFTLDSLANAGTEKSTLDIISHFSKQVEAKVIYFYPGDDLRPEYEKAGIPVYFADLKGKRSLFSGTRHLRKLIQQEKPDLVVSSIMRANLISRFASVLTGVPVIGTFVNDSYGEIRVEEFRRKKQYAKFRFFWLLDKFTSGIPVYWISNAISIAKSNARALGIGKQKIKVIYRGRETSLFPPWQPLPVNETFRFVFIGRLLQRKGLEELMEAFKWVKVKHPHARIDIYGEGLFRKKLEAKVAELRLEDSVILHGKVMNGWKKLYDAHCFVFPSWYEGFSGSLVEAMVAGIPIIASDIPMNLEAVDTGTALICRVKDVGELAAAMEKMILNYGEMTEMGKRARKVASDRFDIRRIASEYEQFLMNVVNKKVESASLI
jgi:glycosyltransferase involved in cell wall biosynthesis